MVHHRKPNDKETERKVEEMGKRFNQDSVLHSREGKNMMVFTTGKNSGKKCGGVGYKMVPDAEDYYTDIPLKEGETTARCN